MKFAVLFWCYKELDICLDRLTHLRRYNPFKSIFILYGGDPLDSERFKAALSPIGDHFYVFDGRPPGGVEEWIRGFRGGAYWKYYFGDLLIASWYREAGQFLEWDTIIVVQWDMLVFGRVESVFRSLKKDQILLSGLRPVREVETEWAWVSPNLPEHRSRYLAFLDHVRDRYGYDSEPLGFVAVVLGLPRRFLEEFSAIPRPDLGFLEYRLPIYAQIFGTPFCDPHPFRPWWGAVEPYRPTSILRARPWPVSILVIFLNLILPWGGRVFHPYWGKIPRGFAGWMAALAASIARLLSRKKVDRGVGE